MVVATGTQQGHVSVRHGESGHRELKIGEEFHGVMLKLTENKHLSGTILGNSVTICPKYVTEHIRKCSEGTQVTLTVRVEDEAKCNGSRVYYLSSVTGH